MPRAGADPPPPFDAELEGYIRECFQDKLPDTEAAKIISPKYASRGQQLSVWKYREFRKQLGLLSVREQAHTVETVAAVITAARARHPNAGLRDLMKILTEESVGRELRVPRRVIREWMEQNEPEAVAARKGKVIKRRQFFSNGPNEIWAIDQHDKWKRFGMWMHVGLDVFSGRVLWLKVYWTNSNPRLICHYYMDAIREHGGMPLLTHSDPGTENFGVANAQTLLRHLHDPTLFGTSQHRWLRKHSNIKPEIFWSQLRRRWSEGLETILQIGIDQGWYDSHSNLQMLIFRWVWMPVVQYELDAFKQRYNTSAKRSNTKTVLPAGRPKYIHEFPEQYGGEQLMIKIKPEHVAVAEREFCEPGHPVFQWTPPNFNQLACRFYVEMGEPMLTRETGWQCYHGLLERFRAWPLTEEIEGEVDFQGQLQADLHVQSESGSHRGDAWGYDISSGLAAQDSWGIDTARLQLRHPVPEEDFDFEPEEMPEIEFSDGE
ncbi:hypothetical protein FRC12_024225 [Ceratobasidium sp. 428]|nr:hypothetical protein FRC12_024225 [Ceratobasidium sp. 428]